ncbi:hypothetical protein Athai_48370 [Actinocatenispora thailandica]|uniref:STAS domain-containing protein n=1 Tax=Actinocatenispora thailandica TaxID=227318 RepID=A0A7R7DT25_9ACTN|nr:hypothetical protein Athai_48370 [Actinocatenispora thailandica]
MRWELVSGLGFDLVRLFGSIDEADGPRVRHELSAILIAHPRAVADCTGLRASGPAALALLCHAHERAGGWPASRLCLYGLGGEQARWYREAALAEQVPLRDSMPEAVAALAEPPRRLRRSATLVAGRRIAREARSVIDSCAADWKLPRSVSTPAMLAASEVVNGAVEAGAAEVRILVEREPGRLAVTVLAHRDDSAELGTLTEITLDAFADAWSTESTPYGRRTRATFVVD